MKYINLTYLLLFSTLLCLSCSSDLDNESALPLLPGDETWVEKDIEGSSITVKPFLPGDAVSRSSFEFDGQNLVFGWKQGDKVGIYPTATSKYDEQICMDESHPHPAGDDVWRIMPNKSQQTQFECSELRGSQTAKLTNENSDEYFKNEQDRWTAYFPYEKVNPDEVTYEARTFSFENQTQEGLPNMTAFYYGDGGQPAGSSNTLYRESEALACKHLGAKDVMISPETEWNSYRINFQMRHVGAVVRLFLLAPEEELVITNIKLICDKPIFYKKGTFTLKSHPYNASDENKGVNFNLGDADCQISPIVSSESGPSKMIELNFKDETAKTYVESTWMKRYVVAYMMIYPVTYNPETDGNLFAYATAYKQNDPTKKEYHFVTNPLSGKVMRPGYYYQWTEMTHPDDGLYPIELTATLLPWQDIVGAGIETDLEK